MLRDRRRLAALAGMIGPVLFVATFTIEGWLRPGYDAVAMYISELSLGSRGWVQITNFVVFGALLLAFARGVAVELPDGKASRAGPILLAIIAGAFILSGPFVMDPATTVPEELSLPGLVHLVLGAVVFSLFPASCFVLWRRFREDPKWRWIRWWTLAAATVVTLAVVVQLVVRTTPPAPPHAWAGIIQRTAILTYMAWLFAFAVGLLSCSSAPAPCRSAHRPRRDADAGP